MYNFCSITSVNYVYQTLALTTCLKKEKFNILCLDKDSLNFFLSKNLKKVKVFSLDDLTYQKNLNDIRINRSYLEFIFTFGMQQHTTVVEFTQKRLQTQQDVILLLP